MELFTWLDTLIANQLPPALIKNENTLLLLVQSTVLLGTLQPILRGGYFTSKYPLIVMAQFFGASLIDVSLYLLFWAVRRGSFWLLKRVALQ